jgi:hypothetical protein
MANGREKYSTVTPEWNSEQIQLKYLLMKSDLPMVAKIVKGQFHHLGVSKIPLRKLQQEVFVHSVKTGVKILAHSVQRYETKDGLSRIVNPFTFWRTRHLFGNSLASVCTLSIGLVDLPSSDIISRFEK